MASHYRNLCCGPRKVQVSAKLLRTHHDVGATISFSRNHGNQGNARFGVSVKKLCATSNDSGPFLVCPGKVTGDIDQGDDGDAKSVQESDESSRFLPCVDVESSCHLIGLAGNNPDGATFYSTEADHDVGREQRLNLEERARVNDSLDDGGDVIRNRRAIRNNLVHPSVTIRDF